LLNFSLPFFPSFRGEEGDKQSSLLPLSQGGKGFYETNRLPLVIKKKRRQTN